MGKFRLCAQFTTGQACRVSETNCSFAHSELEIELWEFDRSRHLNISDFITDQNEKLSSGSSKFCIIDSNSTD